MATTNKKSRKFESEAAKKNKKIDEMMEVAQNKIDDKFRYRRFKMFRDIKEKTKPNIAYHKRSVFIDA